MSVKRANAVALLPPSVGASDDDTASQDDADDTSALQQKIALLQRLKELQAQLNAEQDNAGGSDAEPDSADAATADTDADADAHQPGAARVRAASVAGEEKCMSPPSRSVVPAAAPGEAKSSAAQAVLSLPAVEAAAAPSAAALAQVAAAAAAEAEALLKEAADAAAEAARARSELEAARSASPTADAVVEPIAGGDGGAGKGSPPLASPIPAREARLSITVSPPEAVAVRRTTVTEPAKAVVTDAPAEVLPPFAFHLSSPFGAPPLSTPTKVAAPAEWRDSSSAPPKFTATTMPAQGVAVYVRGRKALVRAETAFPMLHFHFADEPATINRHRNVAALPHHVSLRPPSPSTAQVPGAPPAPVATRPQALVPVDAVQHRQPLHMRFSPAHVTSATFPYDWTLLGSYGLALPQVRVTAATTSIAEAPPTSPPAAATPLGDSGTFAPGDTPGSPPPLWSPTLNGRDILPPGAAAVLGSPKANGSMTAVDTKHAPAPSLSRPQALVLNSPPSTPPHVQHATAAGSTPTSALTASVTPKRPPLPPLPPLPARSRTSSDAKPPGSPNPATAVAGAVASPPALTTPTGGRGSIVNTPPPLSPALSTASSGIAEAEAAEVAAAEAAAADLARRKAAAAAKRAEMIAQMEREEAAELEELARVREANRLARELRLKAARDAEALARRKAEEEEAEERAEAEARAKAKADAKAKAKAQAEAQAKAEAEAQAKAEAAAKAAAEAAAAEAARLKREQEAAAAAAKAAAEAEAARKKAEAEEAARKKAEDEEMARLVADALNSAKAMADAAEAKRQKEIADRKAAEEAARKKKLEEEEKARKRKAEAARQRREAEEKMMADIKAAEQALIAKQKREAEALRQKKELEELLRAVDDTAASVGKGIKTKAEKDKLEKLRLEQKAAADKLAKKSKRELDEKLAAREMQRQIEKTKEDLIQKEIEDAKAAMADKELRRKLLKAKAEMDKLAKDKEKFEAMGKLEGTKLIKAITQPRPYTQELLPYAVIKWNAAEGTAGWEPSRMARCIMFDVRMTGKAVYEAREVVRKVRIRTNPFQFGAMRLAYYIQFEETGVVMVAKRSKSLAAEENSFSFVCSDAESQLLAKRFAYDFTKLAFAATGDRRNIDFVSVGLVEYNGEWYAFEPLLPTDKSYEKYNNNASFQMQDNFRSVFAFGHWTHAHTSGLFMVCDLQGVGYTLTDPQVHSKEKVGERRFGAGNLGAEGMKLVFAGHRCNNICKAMKLDQHPDQKDKSYNTDEGKSSAYELDMICVCGRPWIEKNPSALRDLFDKRLANQDVLCPTCTSELSGEPEISAKCAACGLSFKYRKRIQKLKFLPEVATHCSKDDCLNLRAQGLGTLFNAWRTLHVKLSAKYK